MDEAVALFKAGKVEHLLVSGDNSRRGYDEPTIMRRLAIQGGVPPAQVTVDYAGFDTSDSCVRARRIFGVDEAVLVTQGFHIRRAIFLCRRAGLDAVGLVASEAMFTDQARLRLQVREAAAAPKAWWEGYVDPRPTYLGEFVGLVGSEHPANSDPEVDG
jgi:vancomycin permeability regulator SanA